MTGLVALQVLQGRVPPVSDFQESYWQVTYQAGFVRRGLGGELLRTLGPATPATVLSAVWAMAWLPVAAIVVLLVTLLASRRWPAVWMAIALAASPFVVDQLVVNRRPDQLGLLVLVPAVLALARLRRPAWMLGALGLLLAVLVLVHEGAFLFYAIWLPLTVLVVRGDAGWRRQLFWLALLWLPALATLAVSFVAGRADDSVVATLTLFAQVEGLIDAEPTIHTSVLPFLTNTLAESVAFVASKPPINLASAVLLGLVLVVAHLLLVRPVLRRRDEPRSKLLLPASLMVVAAVLFTFATGVDWPRWFSCFGTSALVVLAAVTLRRDASIPSPPAPTAWVLMLVAGVVLASLPPLWEFPLANQWLHLIPFGPYGK